MTWLSRLWLAVADPPFVMPSMLWIGLGLTGASSHASARTSGSAAAERVEEGGAARGRAPGELRRTARAQHDRVARGHRICATTDLDGRVASCAPYAMRRGAVAKEAPWRCRGRRHVSRGPQAGLRTSTGGATVGPHPRVGAAVVCFGRSAVWFARAVWLRMGATRCVEPAATGRVGRTVQEPVRTRL